MYYPYLRGKQFELLTVREMAEPMAKSGFVPIIEPVREPLNGLSRALDAITSARGKAIVILNPQYGSYINDSTAVSEMLHNQGYLQADISPGLLLRPETSQDAIANFLDAYKDAPATLIHAGFNDPSFVSLLTNSSNNTVTNVFLDEHAGFLYRRHFSKEGRVLVKDGFSQKKRNADYPEVELFSDLHLTYEEYGATAFGDFLMVGDSFSEGGGPAYAVALHLTFIDSTNDEAMYIHHFVSETRDTPTDTAGKFAEALDLMVMAVDAKDSQIYQTKAVQEFLDLHKKGHFPGLGYVKKLSMNHHIETLAKFLGTQ